MRLGLTVTILPGAVRGGAAASCWGKTLCSLGRGLARELMEGLGLSLGWSEVGESLEGKGWVGDVTEP